MDLKWEIKKLKKLQGKTRGDSFKNLIYYIRKEKGEEEIKKIAEELKKAGFELPELKKIKVMDWIPISIPTIYIVACMNIFNWHEEDIVKMGKGIVPYSNVIKFFIRYFKSLEQTLQMGVDSWQKNYSFGEISIAECSQKERRVILRLKKHDRHPVVCLLYMGIFLKIIEMALGNKKFIIEETKCKFKGDDYHEYKITW